jgi:hypothetical protein
LAQPKRAGLVIYEGKYVFLNDREPAREYLKVNAKAILAAYGDQHRIKKEDASVYPSERIESVADIGRSHRSSSSLEDYFPRNGR